MDVRDFKIKDLLVLLLMESYNIPVPYIFRTRNFMQIKSKFNYLNKGQHSQIRLFSNRPALHRFLVFSLGRSGATNSTENLLAEIHHQCFTNTSISVLKTLIQSLNFSVPIYRTKCDWVCLIRFLSLKLCHGKTLFNWVRSFEQTFSTTTNSHFTHKRDS